jgi:hypothetical protein
MLWETPDPFAISVYIYFQMETAWKSWKSMETFIPRKMALPQKRLKKD